MDNAVAPTPIFLNFLCLRELSHGVGIREADLKQSDWVKAVRREFVCHSDGKATYTDPGLSIRHMVASLRAREHLFDTCKDMDRIETSVRRTIALSAVRPPDRIMGDQSDNMFEWVRSIRLQRLHIPTLRQAIAYQFLKAIGIGSSFEPGGIVYDDSKGYSTVSIREQDDGSFVIFPYFLNNGHQPSLYYFLPMD